jgi:hypothetical protein
MTYVEAPAEYDGPGPSLFLWTRGLSQRSAASRPLQGRRHQRHLRLAGRHRRATRRPAAGDSQPAPRELPHRRPFGRPGASAARTRCCSGSRPRHFAPSRCTNSAAARWSASSRCSSAPTRTIRGASTWKFNYGWRGRKWWSGATSNPRAAGPGVVPRPPRVSFGTVRALLVYRHGNPGGVSGTPPEAWAERAVGGGPQRLVSFLFGFAGRLSFLAARSHPAVHIPFFHHPHRVLIFRRSC